MSQKLVIPCSVDECDRIAYCKCNIMDGRVGCGDNFCKPHWKEHKAQKKERRSVAECYQCGKPTDGVKAYANQKLRARMGRKASVFYCDDECLAKFATDKCDDCGQDGIIKASCKICYHNQCRPCSETHGRKHAMEMMRSMGMQIGGSMAVPRGDCAQQ